IFRASPLVLVCLPPANRLIRSLLLEGDVTTCRLAARTIRSSPWFPIRPSGTRPSKKAGVLSGPPERVAMPAARHPAEPRDGTVQRAAGLVRPLPAWLGESPHHVILRPGRSGPAPFLWRLSPLPDAPLVWQAVPPGQV